MTIKVTYNVTDVYVTQDVSPVYINVSYSTGSSGGAAVWGGITGTLSNQTDLQSALDLKVPYTGATTNVNLGEYEIKAGQVTLDTSPTGTAAVGTTRWNDTLGSTETTLKGGSVILKNGVDLVARVVNKVSPNTTLTKAAYQAVRVSGAQGQRLAVAFAQANNDNNSADTIGLVTETIATNQEGFIITVGQLENINTTGSLQGETWADGDVLYLSPTTAGALTNVKPNATIGHIVVVGYVEYAHAINGKIYVKVMNGWELGELHDVYVPTPSNNDVLTYETSSGLWKNKSVGTALGYTPANAATTLTINGVTYDLSTSRTWTVGSVTGSGASGQVAYWDGTTSQAGSNNLFWDNTNGRLGVGTNAPLYTIEMRGARFSQTGTTTTAATTLYQIIDNTSTVNNSYVLFGVDINGSNTGFNQQGTYLSTGRNGTGTLRPIILHNYDNQPIIFATSNTERARIFGTGNFGIGTGATDGGQRLQVQGTTLLNGNVTFSSSTGMFWDATNGLLGIGTSTPFTTTGGAKGLVINSGANSDCQIRVQSNATGSTATDGFLFSLNSALNAYLWNYESASLIFGTNNAERFRVVSNGNLLIGSTTDSGERLQVTGNAKIVGNVSFGGVASVNNSITLTSPDANSSIINFASSTVAQIGAFLCSGPSVVYGTYEQRQLNLLSAASGGIGFRTNNLSNAHIRFYAGNANSDFSSEVVRIVSTNGNLILQNGGTFTDVASSRLTINSTTQGFLPPRMTTTQKNAISSPAAGLVVYDTTLNKLCVYTTAWETITSI